MADVNLAIVQQHAVDGLDGGIGSLVRLVVHVAITLGSALFVGDYFARQDVAEGRESIMERLRRYDVVSRDKLKLQCAPTLLSIPSSRFLMKMLPWPVLRSAGSRWDHMIRLKRTKVRQPHTQGQTSCLPRTTFDEGVIEGFKSTLA